MTADLSFEPAVTLTRLPAAILISSPVCGLRPVRAAVATCSNERKPGIVTFSPLATASETAENRPSTTRPTVAWLSPVLAPLPPQFSRSRDAVMLAAGAALADAGSRLHPDHRAVVAFEQVLRAPVAGLVHAERAFIASAIHAR